MLLRFTYTRVSVNTQFLEIVFHMITKWYEDRVLIFEKQTKLPIFDITKNKVIMKT